MVIGYVHDPVLEALDQAKGIYSSPALVVELRSLGFNRGVEWIWKWSVGDIDIGLMGARDGRSSLAILCNSQPHHGTGSLRLFQQTVAEVGPDGLFLILDEAHTDLAPDQMRFTILPDGRLIYETTLALARPRDLRWTLQKLA